MFRPKVIIGICESVFGICEKVFGICESVFGICAGLFWKERGPAECSGVPPMQSSDKEYCFRVTLEPPTAKYFGKLNLFNQLLLGKTNVILILRYA